MKKFLLTTLLGLGLTMNATAKVALTGTFSDASKYWDDGIKNKIFTDITDFRRLNLHDIQKMTENIEFDVLDTLRTLGKLCLLNFDKTNNLKRIRMILMYYNNAFSIKPAITWMKEQKPDLFKKITSEPLATYGNKKLIIKYNDSKLGFKAIQICIE